MKSIRLLCDLKSESAKRLAISLSEAFKVKVLRVSKEVANREYIRYGDQKDKLTQYKYFRENKLNFPFFTESKWTATTEMEELSSSIVCRTLLRAKSGKGIVIADTVEQLVDAPVYVVYQKKTNEYRVNLFKEEVVCVREKRLKTGYIKPEGRDGRVRSHDNGYVFCEPLQALPEHVIEMAKKAAKITASDIVGVDLAYHKPTDYWFLLEVNSAPGMEGKTIEQYTEVILKHYKE